jgi:hypothetical protein
MRLPKGLLKNTLQLRARLVNERPTGRSPLAPTMLESLVTAAKSMKDQSELLPTQLH